jgi:branched-chain amino acid transport system substrate-binding protein
MSIASQLLRLNRLALSAIAATSILTAVPAQAQTAQPIKIGFGMALSGPLAANGKMSLERR